LHGLGGVGKTKLAAAVARKREVRRAFPDGIIWVALTSYPDRQAMLQTIASYFGYQQRFVSEAEGRDVLRRLLADKAALLVFDDLTEATDIQLLSILGIRCSALVVTRDARMLQSLNSRSVTVSEFSEDEGLRLLAETISLGDEPPPEARELVRQLGGLPLALDLAAAYIRQNRCSLREYLSRFRDANEQLLAGEGASRSSLQAALEQMLAGFSLAEQRCLAQLCLALQAGEISEEAVHRLWSVTGNLSATACDALLNRLQNSGLARIAGEGQQRRIMVHQLVQDLLRRLNLAP